MIPTECEQCGAQLRRAGRGRPQRFCSARCRVASHRVRTAIPAELRQARRWVRRGQDKAPRRADTGRPASSTDPASWSEYAAAVRSPHGTGLGYVLAAGDGVVCLDLDHCLDDGRPVGWAAEILAACPPTYVEVSLSGTGLHVWGRGQLERGRRIRRGDGAAIEAYGAGRYIALGHRYDQAPLQLADLTEVLDALL